MRIKYLSAVCMALILSMGLFSTTAFAYAGGAEETEPTEPPAEEVVEEPMKPLTPDGNLTLVDDEGNTPKSGKQFITIVTKTGNYFYLIIDRDDEGKETVHFLNQVDEADLMKLMDEEEPEQFTPQQPKPEPAPEPKPAPEVQEPEPKPEKKPNVLPAILTVLLLVGGGGFYAFKKLKSKKAEKEQEKPDPDADYVDDDLDYGYEESDGMEDDDYTDEVNNDTEPV